MNILIDGRIWSLYSAGIGNFFTNAILEWARQKSDNTFYIILPKGLDTKYELTTVPSNITLLDYSNGFPCILPNIIILQILVPYLCRKLKISLYYAPVPHLPYFIPSNVKTMITVHDVVNIEMPYTMSWTNKLATSIFFGKAIKKADYLWTNSNYTRSKVEEYFPKRNSKDIFVGGAVDRHIFYSRTITEKERLNIKTKHGINNHFILFVGSLEPRKNLKFLLEVIPDLFRNYGIQLVIVGGKSWKSSHLKSAVEDPSFPKDSCIFCGYIKNEDLAMLYNVADCFVSAALMEGFGMPQLEALLCGCPIITADNTAMTEIAKGKDGAFLVSGYNIEEWQNVILRVINEKPIVNPQQLNKYDWEVIIGQLITVY